MTSLKNESRGYAIIVLALGMVTGCEQLHDDPENRVLTILANPIPDSAVADPNATGVETSTAVESTGLADDRSTTGIYEPGSGVFVSEASRVQVAAKGSGEVTVNFEDTELVEVVQVILGDLLAENYVIDPAVQGNVTLQTSRPLRRSALIPTLEMLLRASDAALVFNQGLYQVVPRGSAIQGLVSPQLGDETTPLPKGYRVQIVQLRHIAATQMQAILEPFANTDSIMRVDTARNLLVLAGTGGELDHLLRTVDMFDVDWLKGMSVALFTPEHIDAKTLADALKEIVSGGQTDSLQGPIRISAFERLNGVMVVTPIRSQLEQVASWVERLDKEPSGLQQNLYVYYVQNGKAVDLAAVLSEVFAGRTSLPLPAARLAPGLEPVTIESARTPAAPASDALTIGNNESGARNNLAVGGSSIRIIADEVNNALLVLGTASDYRQVRSALKKLDIVPLQVLIETTIAEVTLSGDLRYGLEWFFKNGTADSSGSGTLDLGIAGLSALTPGFSYAITDAADTVRVVLNALAGESRVNVISSPSLMVLNNQTSTIKVGDEVPITTQQQQSTAAESTVVNNIEFRDTGVLLSVTPRVNAGGLVTMEIEQEVSNVSPGSDPLSLTPTIQQRRITSTVAVKSGHTVVLGGLIRENKTLVRSGIPVLYKLPFVGPLFGTTSDGEQRTELVVLITPRVIQSAHDADAILNEFRDHLDSLKPLY